MESPDKLANDSYDNLLASIDEPMPQTSSSDQKTDAIDSGTTSVSSEPKKAKLSDEASGAGSSTSNVTSNNPAGQPVQTASKPMKTNCVLVNPKQRGNPILKSITNVPWEFDDSIIPDYVVGTTAGILFLSLRYHQLNPDYIHNRLKELGKRFELRVLLVQVDTKVSYLF